MVATCTRKIYLVDTVAIPLKELAASDLAKNTFCLFVCFCLLFVCWVCFCFVLFFCFFFLGGGGGVVCLPLLLFSFLFVFVCFSFGGYEFLLF